MHQSDNRDADPRPDNTKSISQVASEHSVSPRTLRFYEEKGLLTPTKIGVTRYYNPKDEIRLRLIHKGKMLGFSLKEINQFFLSKDAVADGPVNALPETFFRTLSKEQILEQIGFLESRRADLDEALSGLRKIQASLSGE